MLSESFGCDSGPVALPSHRIGAFLGRGSFGEVFEVRGADGALLASKTEPVGLKSLALEARVLELLDGSPGFARLVEWGKTQSHNYLVMTLLGQNLETVLANSESGLPIELLLRVGYEGVGLLETLHSKGVVHRDIKPENLLLGHPNSEEESTLHLIDFGLSAFLSPPLHPSTPQSPNSRPAKPGLARTGTITGTLRYASISCMNKGPPSRRDDLESLLYTLVYLGRGTLPWKELGEVARLGGEGDRPRGGETNGKFERTKKMKEATSSKSLCGNLPECFRVFADYAKELSVEEVPAYGLLRQLFANEAKRLGFDLKRKDAWDFFRKKKSRRTFEKEKAEKGKNWECRGPCFALIERKNHYEFFEKKENRKPVEANIL